MGVIMQAFYWDCPRLEGKEFQWWEEVKKKVPSLSTVGFTALWLPPASKGANIDGPSMGYDPYDFYDLGEYDQKGSIKTWFGSKEQLLNLIETAHTNSMEVYADVVFNHNSGADAQEVNKIDGISRWTKFTPKSNRFPRDWQCFHPSCYETWDKMTFEGMPDLCHRNPYVYSELIEYSRWLLEEVGFDGFRYDCVKGYGGWLVRSLQELRILRKGAPVKPYGVGECWDCERTIDTWLDETNAWSDNQVGAFDFPLRDRLKSICDSYEYSLRNLATGGTLTRDRSSQAVTFVENHDIVRDNPIINDKLLAYAVILTHEGYPCVFWKDYYVWNLGQEGNRSGIAALVSVHEQNANGPTDVLYAGDDLYIMQRRGHSGKPGLIFVLNNRGDGWHGAWVATNRQSTRFVPAAWRGRDDVGIPDEKWTGPDGTGDFWAPPRGYAVYVPEP